LIINYYVMRKYFFSDSILIISFHRVPLSAGVMFHVLLFIIYNYKVDYQLCESYLYVTCLIDMFLNLYIHNEFNIKKTINFLVTTNKRSK